MDARVVLVVLVGFSRFDYLYEAAQLDGPVTVSVPLHYPSVIAFHLQLVILLRVIDGFRLFIGLCSNWRRPRARDGTITMYI